MTHRKTAIIAIEGIDGSGKTVQWELLFDKLVSRGLTVETMSFPNYDGFFGSRCGDLLRGDVLRADQVDSRSLCLWYALDRWDRFKNHRDSANDCLLINRYALSNAVYQSIRDIDVDQPDIWDWVRQLEHGELGLPEPDIYILLDVDPARAQRNVDQKEERGYVKGRDVYEAAHGLLERARARYLDIAAREKSIAVIRCMDESTGQLRAREAIAADVWNAVTSVEVAKKW